MNLIHVVIASFSAASVSTQTGSIEAQVDNDMLVIVNLGPDWSVMEISLLIILYLAKNTGFPS